MQSGGHWQRRYVFSWSRAFSRPSRYQPIRENGCCWVRRRGGSPRRVHQPVLSDYSAVLSIGLWRPLFVYLVFWACAALIISTLWAFFNIKCRVPGYGESYREAAQVKYIASKFHDRKHAPELDILPMLLAAAGGSPGQIMGKNCTLPAFYCWRLWLMVWRQRMAKKVTSNRIAT